MGKEYEYICRNRKGRDGDPPCPIGSQPAPQNKVQIPREKVPDPRKRPKCPHCSKDSLEGPIRSAKTSATKYIITGALIAAVCVALFLIPGCGCDAEISGLPRAVNFGEVVPGESNSQTILIGNEGEGALQVTEFKIEPGVFSGPSDTLEIPPGEKRQVSLTFKPTAEGDYSGTLMVKSNDCENGEVQIKLIGKAGKVNWKDELDKIIKGSKTTKP